MLVALVSFAVGSIVGVVISSKEARQREYNLGYEDAKNGRENLYARVREGKLNGLL